MDGGDIVDASSSELPELPGYMTLDPKVLGASTLTVVYYIVFSQNSAIQQLVLCC